MQARHGPIFETALVGVSAQSRSVGVSTLGVNGRQLNETSKRAEGQAQDFLFFI